MCSDKLKVLEEYIESLGSVAVAFSWGVDSTFLLKVAKNVLKDKLIAITARSDCFSESEFCGAVEFCKKENIKHIVFDYDVINDKSICQNPPNRCYLCKKLLFSKICEIAKSNGIENVIEGTNSDDEKDYRPGLKAIEELGVKSPLRYSKLNKNEIRVLSKKLGLSTFDKPSFACLLSRFVYYEEITPQKVQMVSKAENLLFSLGFRQVRVRLHNNLARVEVLPDEFEKILNHKDEIVQNFKDYGFSYVTLDLIGYRTGSMNETLET